MTDLVAFLTARLDEDEQVARAVPSAFDLFDGTGIVVMPLHGGLTRSVTLPASVARFVVRHDPARVLRDVESSRWILGQHVHYRFPPHPEGWLPQDYEATQPAFPGSDMPYVGCAVCVWNSNYEHVDANTWCGYVRRLATAWSDHPDYRAGWRP